MFSLFGPIRITPRLWRSPTLALASIRAAFHASPAGFVKVGDKVPDLEVLTEGSPSNKVNLAKELATGNGVIIGVPAAFSKLYIRSPTIVTRATGYFKLN